MINELKLFNNTAEGNQNIFDWKVKAQLITEQ